MLGHFVVGVTMTLTYGPTGRRRLIDNLGQGAHAFAAERRLQEALGRSWRLLVRNLNQVAIVKKHYCLV